MGVFRDRLLAHVRSLVRRVEHEQIEVVSNDIRCYAKRFINKPSDHWKEVEDECFADWCALPRRTLELYSERTNFAEMKAYLEKHTNWSGEILDKMALVGAEADPTTNDIYGNPKNPDLALLSQSRTRRLA
ncbi:hypothetical protein MP228_009538 [Amoeboaphelidium protococcarum]|nr:hypothetical protein MP228_009538 [Amoeboaphelidium protococcarum]